MKIDYDILKSFIPEKDKKYFLAFVNAYFDQYKKNIICPYRCLLEEKQLKVKVSDYKKRVRIKKIENI